MNSLRTRLLLAYVGLILAGFIVLALIAGRQISAGTVQDFTTALAEQAQLVARGLHEPLEEIAEGEGTKEMLRGALQTYAAQTGAELVLLDQQGRVLMGSADSSTTRINTPLVEAAIGGSIGSEAEIDTAYAAAPIYEDGRLLGVIHLAAPLSAAQSLVWERWLQLGGAVLAVTAVAGGAAFWLSTTLTRPLARLQQAALQIASGDFSPRLAETRQDEFGQVSRAFNHMAAQVAAMIEEQRAFASNASHELRTPLTNIRLRSEALRDGALDAVTAQQYAAEIDDEAQRMGNLVQDLMLLSRLDSGRLEAGREKIDPERLARQLLMEIKPQADARGIRLRLNAPPDLPPMTAGQVHLQILFRNLLSNALKYTPDGGQIRWMIAAAEGEIRHTISDTGEGVAANDLPRLFDRFFRVDKSRSRAVPGVGLGLSLVRTIVEFYGGAIRMESAGFGAGTAVYVVWPT